MTAENCLRRPSDELLYIISHSSGKLPVDPFVQSSALPRSECAYRSLLSCRQSVAPRRRRAKSKRGSNARSVGLSRPLEKRGFRRTIRYVTSRMPATFRCVPIALSSVALHTETRFFRAAGTMCRLHNVPSAPCVFKNAQVRHCSMLHTRNALLYGSNDKLNAANELI